MIRVMQDTLALTAVMRDANKDSVPVMGPPTSNGAGIVWRDRFAQLRASGEMADAPASGAGARKGVGVQVPPRARNETRSDQGFTGRGGFSFCPHVLNHALSATSRALGAHAPSFANYYEIIVRYA